MVARGSVCGLGVVLALVMGVVACGGSGGAVERSTETVPSGLVDSGEASEVSGEPAPSASVDPDVVVDESERSAYRPEGLAAWPERPSCGSYVNNNVPPDQVEGQAEANECILAAARDGKPAEVVATYLTVEGDPIVNYVRVLGPDRFEVFIDTTADAYGPGTWIHQVCEGLVEEYGFLQPERCTDVQDGGTAGADVVVQGFGDVEGAWLFVGGRFGGREIPVVAGYRVTLIAEAERLGGRGPCNRYGTQRFEINAGTIMIEEVAQTAIGCAVEVMESEEMYVTAFRLSEGIALVDGELQLSASNDAVLRFVRLPDAPIEEISARSWLLETILRPGGPALVAGEPSTLELHADETLSVSTGCRTLTGDYIVQGDEILTTRTQAAGGGECPPDLSEQDALVVEAVGDGFVPWVEGNHLTVTSRGNLQLIYRSVETSDSPAGASGGHHKPGGAIKPGPPGSLRPQDVPPGEYTYDELITMGLKRSDFAVDADEFPFCDDGPIPRSQEPLTDAEIAERERNPPPPPQPGDGSSCIPDPRYVIYSFGAAVGTSPAPG